MENLKKALELRKSKYLKRTGAPGNYKYIYKRPVERRKKKKPEKSSSPNGVKSTWTPKSGGILFHGTSMPDDKRYLRGDEDGVVYFTNDYKEAEAYAKGIHLGGRNGGNRRVIYVFANEGKTIDINNKVEEAIMEGDDLGPIFDWAKKQGAEFATYNHPSNVNTEGYQEVIVSLNPGDQLAPNRRGWNVDKNKKWFFKFSVR